MTSLDVIGLCSFLGFGLLYLMTAKESMDHIPTIGPNGPIASYIGAIQYLFNAQKMLLKGYDTCKGGIFKVASMTGWIVVVSTPKYIEEVAKATDKELSQRNHLMEILSTKHTIGDIFQEDYHSLIMQNELTRGLSELTPLTHDEMINSFARVIPVIGDEWMSVPAYETMTQAVVQIVNRSFVGVPLCRDPDYLNLNAQFTKDVLKGGENINLFPRFLQPIVGPLFSKREKSIARGEKHLGPLVEDRRRNLKDFGETSNDFLSWLIQMNPDQTLRDLTSRLLTSNMAAVHSTAKTFTHALFHLLANPEYIQPLREEAGSVIQAEGWTKAALDKMWKADSLFKESSRLDGIIWLTMSRKVVEPFTFSDGTRLAVGTTVCAAAGAIHTDESNYANSTKFEPFRFAKMRERENDDPKHQFSTTSRDFLAFGHGKHACPGRWFASNELKAMLAYVLITYDMKFDAKNDSMRPPNAWHAKNCTPNATARIMFKARTNGGRE